MQRSKKYSYKTIKLKFFSGKETKKIHFGLKPKRKWNRFHILKKNKNFNIGRIYSKFTRITQKVLR